MSARLIQAIAIIIVLVGVGAGMYLLQNYLANQPLSAEEAAAADAAQAIEDVLSGNQ